MKRKLLRPIERRWATLLALGAVLLTATAVQAVGPEETDARKIAEAVEARDDGDKQSARIRMTLTDASGRQRVRVMQSQRMDFAAGTKTLMLFDSPADVRNTGLLSIDYEDGNKDDDQWLYLPSLHKSTRISTSDRSGSFLGTDLSYSDMTKKDTKAYDYKLLKPSVMIGDEECWLIESRPRTKKEQEETGYLKSNSWISKSKLMPVQLKVWVKEGKKLKYIKFKDIEQIDGIWTAKKTAVRTVKGGKAESTTVMVFEQIKFADPKVVDADFTERRLEKGL